MTYGLHRAVTVTCRDSDMGFTQHAVTVTWVAVTCSDSDMGCKEQ